jgi:hypothetical protein
MRRRLIILAVIALALPVAAYASTTVTRAGDQAWVTKDSGCRVIENADHSVTVRCPVGQSVTLDWRFSQSVSAATVVCLNHPCKNAPTITVWRHFRDGKGWQTGYSVKQLVHANTIASMTATLN